MNVYSNRSIPHMGEEVCDGRHDESGVIDGYRQQLVNKSHMANLEHSLRDCLGQHSTVAK
jgi:hypothetical protein